MVEEFEKAITVMSPKSFRDLNELINREEADICHWNSKFTKGSLTPLAKALFELKAKLPEKGRLSFQFLPPDLKAEINDFIDILIASNEQLQNMVGLYVDSRLSLVEMYSDNKELHKKAEKDYTNEAKKLIANRILDAVKTISIKELEMKKYAYSERMKIACTRELALDIFNLLAGLTRTNFRNSKGRFLFSKELSKQARKEKAKELESAGGEWHGENDYEL